MVHAQDQAMTPLAKAGASPSQTESERKAQCLIKARKQAKSYDERLRALCYEKPKEAKTRLEETMREFLEAFDVLSQAEAVHTETYFSYVNAQSQLQSAETEIKALLSAFSEVSEDWK